jgi:hypothetical protein
VSAEQAQHPLATDVDAMLPAQPSPNLAVALTGERRVLNHHRQRELVFHGHLGRCAGGIWTPLSVRRPLSTVIGLTGCLECTFPRADVAAPNRRPAATGGDTLCQPPRPVGGCHVLELIGAVVRAGSSTTPGIKRLPRCFPAPGSGWRRGLLRPSGCPCGGSATAVRASGCRAL